MTNKKLVATTSTVAGITLAGLSVVAGAIATVGLGGNANAVGASGAVQLNAEVATAIAMKIASPNDINPDCIAWAGVTYGVANRYATSNGAEGSKQVDTFDGTTGGADELNTNTSCATLQMTPNTFDSTYTDVTVYTNSPNGYAVSLQASEPNLVNVNDGNQYIPAGTLTESNNTVAGGQNAWSYKTDNGIVTSWTPVSTTDTTIKSYDQETSGGDTTRVTYGISAGNNPTGKYATTLTYTATMFDGSNPYVGTIDTDTVANLSVSPATMKIARSQAKTMTVTPATGYYLSSVTCPTGYVCTGYTTDQTDEASAAAQTITIKNESASSANATLGLAVTPLDMQHFSAAAHASDPKGTVYTNLKDSRDGTTYTAKKLEDGNIWMMQNLTLDLPSGQSKRTLTSSDTDLNTKASWDLEDANNWCNQDTDACDNQKLISRTGYTNGETAPTYYYNWYTATAGSGTRSVASGEVSDSICPKGWKLPTNAQFAALDVAYGGTGTNRLDAAQITNFVNNVGFGFTGYRNAAAVHRTTSLAYYWSRSANSAANAYYLLFNSGSGGFNPQYYNLKWGGFAVRCVASS